jgi:DNA-binding NtrC family response regulator
MLHVPPLRQRSDDIPLLTQHFIDFFNEKRVRPNDVTGIDPDALEALQSHDWPGNVRELSNAIEGAFIFGRSPTIERTNLPPGVGGSRKSSRDEPIAALRVGSFADAERDIIVRALEMAAGNKMHAAKKLKISRKRLYAKIQKYGLA